MKTNMLKYKGYYGSYQFDEDDIIFYGKLEFIKPLISYEAKDAPELKAAFQNAVDDYLSTCKERGVEPEKPFKGSFNIRIGSERHEKAALLSKKLGCKSLNEFIKLAIDHEFDRTARGRVN
jgi:predicted HicB family RNase H-like nuclease